MTDPGKGKKQGAWKKNLKKGSQAPKKGYRWKDSTSGRIPEPEVVPITSKKKVKLKPMRTISSGTFGSGAPRRTEKNKSRSL